MFLCGNISSLIRKFSWTQEIILYVVPKHNNRILNSIEHSKLFMKDWQRTKRNWIQPWCFLVRRHFVVFVHKKKIFTMYKCFLFLLKTKMDFRHRSNEIGCCLTLKQDFTFYNISCLHITQTYAKMHFFLFNKKTFIMSL